MKFHKIPMILSTICHQPYKTVFVIVLETCLIICYYIHNHDIYLGNNGVENNHTFPLDICRKYVTVNTKCYHFMLEYLGTYDPDRIGTYFI